MSRSPRAGIEQRKDGGYFVGLARTIAARARIPIMVTGGITERSVAENALTASAEHAAVAMVGIASALAFDLNLPRKWRDGTVLATQGREGC